MPDDIAWHGSMPEAYDQLLVPVIFAPFARYLAGVVHGLAPSTVLELAAGTGVATAALVGALPGASIVATDLSAAMVSWSSERVHGATWRQCDAQHLDFPDDSFDLVVCQFGVMFFSDRPAAYAEAARVLKHDGALVFTVWDAMATSAFTVAMGEALEAVLPEDPPTFLARIPHGYADSVQIEADLEAGGLTHVAIERVVLRGLTRSAASLAEGYCFGTPLRFDLEARGTLVDLTRVVAAEMTKRLGPGEVSADLAAFVVVARPPSRIPIERRVVSPEGDAARG